MMLQKMAAMIAICILAGCSAEPRIVQNNRREIERLEGLLEAYTALYDALIAQEAATQREVEAAITTIYQPQRQRALARTTLEAFIALGVGLFAAVSMAAVTRSVIILRLKRPRP